VLMAILRTTGVIPLDPARGLRLTGDAVRRFIDVYLKHAPRGPLDHLAADYPEITVQVVSYGSRPVTAPVAGRAQRVRMGMATRLPRMSDRPPAVRARVKLPVRPRI
jgi:hypothetical protein